MKKIAFLVLAYEDIAVVHEFSRRFSDERFQFYVHLDIKKNLDQYLDGVEVTNNIHFVDKRTSIYWGGFNMIKATISLIEEALKDIDNEIFVLISDNTFSLLSPDDIYAELISSPVRIDSWRVKPGSDQERRYKNYYYFDSQFTNPRWIAAENRNFESQDYSNINQMFLLMAEGKFELPLYAGSQWWSLSRDVVGKCMAILNNNDRLRVSFKYSAIPDESMFQSLVKLILKEKYPGSPMLYDFSRTPKPYVFKEIGELNNLSVAGKLFLRKVDASSNLIQEIIESKWKI